MTIMALKTMSECARCRHLAERYARTGGALSHIPERIRSCAPVIDAEKSNETLLMVAQIRRRTSTFS